jgi:hypothetical protein
MKLRREAAILKKKAIASIRRAARSFNDFEDDGRVTDVLLHLQHAFEMLLKAGLVQMGIKVFDPNDGKSLGPDKCVKLANQYLKLTESEAGLIRAIDALRDEEQHWFADSDEGVLYIHARGAVTAFDDLLDRVFGERLANHLPARVLPISTEPPADIQTLIDREYSQIGKLLAPGSRKRADAQARIRTLLAMEAHLAEGVLVSKKDVDRVKNAIKAGKDRSEVFPRLDGLGTQVDGEGITVVVRFTKKMGAPVTFVPPDDPSAAGVRQVDLQRTFHLTARALAKRLGLSEPRAFALRRALNIDDDPKCRHDFTFGKSTYPSYSDKALNSMKTALTELDMDQIWKDFRPMHAPKT